MVESIGHGGHPSGGRGHLANAQYSLNVTLTPVRRATVQVEGGRTQFVAPVSPLSFRPPDVTMRFALHEVEAIAILQGAETYRDLRQEIGGLGGINFEPDHDIDDPLLTGLVQAIVKEIDSGFVDNLLVDALNTAVAVQIMRRFSGPGPQLLPAGSLSRERLKRVLDYIEVHLPDELALSEIAAVACLSPFHFSRCFKRSMGVGLHGYVIRRRIERAKQLVANSNLPLAEIAYAVGFDSQASFTARFTRDVGRSPGRFRREVR